MLVVMQKSSLEGSVMGRCTPDTSRSLSLSDTSQVLMSDKTHWLSLALSLFTATMAVTPSSN